MSNEISEVVANIEILRNFFLRKTKRGEADSKKTIHIECLMSGFTVDDIFFLFSIIWLLQADAEAYKCNAKYQLIS